MIKNPITKSRSVAHRNTDAKDGICYSIADLNTKVTHQKSCAALILPHKIICVYTHPTMLIQNVAYIHLCMPHRERTSRYVGYLIISLI